MMFWFTVILSLALASSALESENSNVPTNVSQNYAPGRKCMDHLGCFELGGDFYHPRYRPLNFLPFDREFINVKFRIYTKTSGDSYQLLSALRVPSTNVKDIKVNPNLETKIITHGWLDNQLIGDWMRDYKDDYYTIGDYNVIVVDWSGGNLPPYTQAVANTRVVGAEIALLVNKLVDEKGLDPRRVHIMGHSLGGQIVGYAGERIKNLGRITSLDPAQPFYQWLPPSVRIDPTDAEFVEVIHTDTRNLILNTGIGMSQPAGHVDFFPNNGLDQPGCTYDKHWISIVTEGLVEGLRNVFACNHIRAVNYFRESITNKCPMVHSACSDYETYKAGKCIDCGKNGEKCAILGERSIEYLPHKNDSKSVKMYARTNSKKPYCFYQYQIKIKLQASKINEEGSWYLILSGNGRTEEFQLGGSKTKFTHGGQYTYLWSSTYNLGNIHQISISWKHNKLISLYKRRLFIETIQVTPAHEINTMMREDATRYICAANSEGIESGKKRTFTKFSKC